MWWGQLLTLRFAKMEGRTTSGLSQMYHVKKTWYGKSFCGNSALWLVRLSLTELFFSPWKTLICQNWNCSHEQRNSRPWEKAGEDLECLILTFLGWNISRDGYLEVSLKQLFILKFNWTFGSKKVKYKIKKNGVCNCVFWKHQRHKFALITKFPTCILINKDCQITFRLSWEYPYRKEKMFSM